jgi:hypothetical protein
MLPTTRIDVLLRPAEICVARRSALSPRRAGALRCQPVLPPADGEPWRACVDALGESLVGVRRAADLHVVVSDHFLRYVLMPWNDKLVADAERLAFARFTYAEVYGSLADEWVLTMDEPVAGRASLVCAIDRDFLQALREVATRHGVQLRSVRTVLGERITRHRRALKDGEFCLVSVEPGRLTLAFHNDSGWIAVRTRRTDDDLAELLPSALRQEAAAADATEGGSVYLVGQALDELALTDIEGWKLITINEPAPATPTVTAAAPAGAAAD